MLLYGLVAALDASCVGHTASPGASGIGNPATLVHRGAIDAASSSGTVLARGLPA